MTVGYFRLTHAYLDADTTLRERYLTEVVSRLDANSGATIAELGCGDGVPVAKRLSEVASVIGVDRVETRLRKAQTAVPSGLFVLADFTRLGFKPATLAAVVSFYAMIHVPSAAFPDLLRGIHRWIGDGGWFVGVIGSRCSVFPSDPPPAVTCLPSPELLGALTTTGFEIIESDVDGLTNDAGSIEFTWFLARKRR